MSQLSEPNIIHLQLAVSFIIPFNLLDSARSHSKLSTVYLSGAGWELDVWCVGSGQYPIPEGKVLSVPGADDWIDNYCVLRGVTPHPTSVL